MSAREISVGQSFPTTELGDGKISGPTRSWFKWLRRPPPRDNDSSIRQLSTSEALSKQEDTVSANATERPNTTAPVDRKLEAGFKFTSLSEGVKYGGRSSKFSYSVYGSHSGGEPRYRTEDIGDFNQKPPRLTPSYVGLDPGADDQVFLKSCNELIEELKTGFKGLENGKIDEDKVDEFIEYAKSDDVTDKIKKKEESYRTEIQEVLLNGAN